jgi:hypothetical protein
MSLIIGGISVGGALAAGAATAAGTAIVGSVLGGGKGGGGGGGGGGQQMMMPGGGDPAAAADPFAAWRPQYQQGLSELMGKQPGNDPYNAGAWASANNITDLIPNTTTGGTMMENMLRPGYDFTADPSYQFRLKQGAGALAASGAAKGLLNSGNIAAALTDYGQQAASQEYGAQFARAGQQDQSSRIMQQTRFQDMKDLNQQTFSNLFSMNQADQGNFQNQFNRLSQLSGAGMGSPAAAGQLQQQQNAAAAAGLHQIIDPITGAVKDIAGGVARGWNSGSGGSGGGATDYMGNPLTMYGGNGAAAGVTPYL